MEVTALGHAGLRVVGSNTTGLVDPWMSRDGAFLGSWYQLPANDHLATADLLAPDWIALTTDRADRLDLDTLARVRAGTTLFIPTFASKRLLRVVTDHTALQVVEMDRAMRADLDGGGSWLRLVPAQSPAHQGAAALLSIDGVSVLDINDARLTAAQVHRARLAFGAEVDLLTVNVANPSWFPLCYCYPDRERLRIANDRLLARYEVVLRLLQVVEPRLTVPFGGPPCFLDPKLADLSHWTATPDAFPAPPQTLEWFRLHSPKNAFTTLLPGDRLSPREQLVVTDGHWEHFSYERLPRYLRDYSHQRAVELSRLHAVHPVPDAALGERFTDHFLRLAGLSRYFIERISMTVRFDVSGPAGGRWDVHLYPDQISVDLTGADASPRYRFAIESRWLAAVIDGAATWDDLLHSMRISITREPDVPNDHLFWLLRHADRDALLSIEAFERSHDVTAAHRRTLTS